MDKRVNNGGAREGAGRPKKSDEAELIERLKKFDDIAEAKLIEGVKAGSYPHLKIFYEYRYGKPKQIVDVTTNGNDIGNNNLSNLSFEQLIKLAHGNKGADNTGS